MSPTFYLFVVLIVFYYAIAHQISVMQRTLTSIEDRLKSLHKDALGALRREIREDLQHEIEMHEIRTSD